MPHSADELVIRSKNVSYLPGVDHLRGIAAMLMVVYHGMQQLRIAAGGSDPFPRVHDPVSALVVEGHTAVALFMVVSGFILTYGADRRELRYGPFMRNRVLRVVPMYVVVLFVAVYAVPEAFTFAGFLPYLTLLATPPLPVAEFGAWSAVLWTLSVEFAFYLLFPFLLRFLQRNGARALLGLLLLSNTLRLLVAATNPDSVATMSYWTIVGRIDQFLVGMLAAWWLRRGLVRWNTGRAVLVAAIAAVGVACALWAFNANGSFFGNQRWRAVWPLVEGSLWALFVIAYVVALGDRTGAWVRRAALPGIISYSVYLLHYPVVQAVGRRGWELFDSPVLTAAVLTLVIVIPVTCAVSTLSYLTVERPFMQMRVRYLVNAPDAAPAAST